MGRGTVVGFLVFILFVGVAEKCIAQDPCSHPRLISVVGTAEINVNPDEVVLDIAVDSRDKVLGTAKSGNDARVRSVLTLARTAGVEAKDVQTSALGMQPEYSEEKTPRLLDYQVSQSIVITLRDLSKYETLMSQFLEAGVNRVNGVSFRVAEPRKYRDEARSRAIAAAKEKAAAMASQLGQTLGKPWVISEESGGSMFNYMAVQNVTVQNATRSSGGEAAEESTVAPGQVTIRASVDVSFELE